MIGDAAAVVTAVFNGIALLIASVAAVYARSASRKSTLPDGRSVGDVAPNLEAAMSTPPGVAPAGELLADVHEVVTNGKPEAAG